jgi:hypothetical protein
MDLPALEGRRIVRPEGGRGIPPARGTSFLSLRMAVSSEIFCGNKITDSVWNRPRREMGLIAHDDGKIRAQERAHPAHLALFHLLALRGKVALGVHLLGWFQDLRRAELDADPATLAILLFYVQFGHDIFISIFLPQSSQRTQSLLENRKTSLNSRFFKKFSVTSVASVAKIIFP